jgi:hypothetical protein
VGRRKKSEPGDSGELERLRAELRRKEAELAALQARVDGSGAIAQNRSVAGGAGATVVGRDLHFYAPQPGADDATLREAYLCRLFQ